jgi:hypothetical protein
MAGKTITIDRLLDMSEQLSAADQLRLIGMLSDRLRREMVPQDEPVDVLSTAGLGADLWQSVDVAAYLDEERASWDR